jgi:hypothetical protein
VMGRRGLLFFFVVWNKEYPWPCDSLFSGGWFWIRCTLRVEPRPFGVSRISIPCVFFHSCSYSYTSSFPCDDHPRAQACIVAHFLNRRQTRHVCSRETQNSLERCVSEPSLLHRAWQHRWRRTRDGGCGRWSSSVLSAVVEKGLAWVEHDDRERCRRAEWGLARGSGRRRWVALRIVE